MTRRKWIACHFGLFAAVMALLYGFLVLCAMIPNAALKKNMASSARYYFTQGLYVKQSDGQYRNMTDNRADQLLVNISWHMGEGNPLSAAIDTGYYNGGSFGLTTGLQQSVAGGQQANTPYPQYWHGSAAFVRLAHLFTDVQGMKTLGLWLFGILLFGNVALLIAKKHWDLGLCLVLSLLSVQIWNIGLSITYQPCFLICLALCPAFVLLEKRGDFPLTLLCVLSGGATAFFDFLTTETVTLLIPLILVVAIRTKEGRLQGFPGKLLLSCCLCWAAAYAGAFACKWALSSLVTGENQFLTGLSAAGVRVNGSHSAEIAGNIPEPVAAILTNLSVLFGSTRRIDLNRAIWGVLFTGVAYIGVFTVLKKPNTCNFGIAAVLLPVLAVLLRFALLSNHSYLHGFFTYRALSAAVMGLLTALALSRRRMEGGSPQ